jgi:hypothetical protein
MKRLNPLVVLTAALALGLVGAAEAQNLLVNGTLDVPDIHESDVATGWTLVEGPNTTPLPPGVPMPAQTATFARFADHTTPGDGDVGRGLWFQAFRGGLNPEQPPLVFAHLTQTVPAIVGQRYDMSAWSRFEMFYAGGVDNLNMETPTPPDDGPASPTDTFLALEFLGAGGVVLPGGAVIELRADGQSNDGMWRQHFLNGVAPAGALQVQVRGSMVDGVLNPNVNPQSAFLDDFVLTTIPEPASLIIGLFGVAGLVATVRRR